LKGTFDIEVRSFLVFQSFHIFGWVFVGFGWWVACLEEVGTVRPSDSRYALIFDLMEEVKEAPRDRWPDERTERGNITNDANQVVSLKRWLC